LFSVTILGNNSAVPAHNRHPTSQVLQTSDHTFLIDCGEGTQMQMDAYKIRRSKISRVFISHLHGDHYYGLIGLLTSFGLNQRTAELHIYSSEALPGIIHLQLKAANAQLPYPLIFHTIGSDRTLFEDKKICVQSFAVNHRIECWGFIFREKKNLRKIDPVTIKKFNVPTALYENLHAGQDIVLADGTFIKNDLVTSAVTNAKSYAYCADTSYFEPIIEKIKGVDLLYHEATYLQSLEQKAESRFHSTTKQAATIALKAGVKKLLIGHFSSMYEKLDDFKAEACAVFENTELAVEGACFLL